MCKGAAVQIGAKLISRLLAEGRLEDARLASENPEACARLYEEALK